MKWYIYGIDNREYYNVCSCIIAENAFEKKDFIREYRKQFPLVEVDRQSKNGNINKESYKGFRRKVKS